MTHSDSGQNTSSVADRTEKLKICMGNIHLFILICLFYTVATLLVTTIFDKFASGTEEKQRKIHKGEYFSLFRIIKLILINSCYRSQKISFLYPDAVRCAATTNKLIEYY